MNDRDISRISNEFFNERTEEFIIYVVSKSFTVYNGNSFFKYYSGKPNYIQSEIVANNFLQKIYKWIFKKVQNNPDLVESIFNSVEKFSITETITSMVKLLSASQHQSVGPNIIDPIILLEESINKQQILEIIALNEKKFLNPTIIISMKDDDFSRIKEVLSKCPHGTTLKLIKNSGESEIVKVVNTGADNIHDFIDCYARQCFNACSYTERNILFNNDEWANDSVIKKWSPGIMKIRSLLLYDRKEDSIYDVNHILNAISIERKFLKSNEKQISASLECLLRLFRTYCHDRGGNDFNTAFKIAKELDNDILKAHVLRFSHFLPNTSKEQQKVALEQAKNIFSANRMEDYAVYCQNNSLVSQFYSDKIYTYEFESLRDRALNNVPGLVGISTILNNVGVSYLYNRRYEEAIDWLSKGLKYDKDRNIQQLGLKTNIMIAKSMQGISINENEIKSLILDNIEYFRVKGAFLGASYILNILLIANKTKGLADHIIREYPIIKEMISAAVDPNCLGSTSLMYQLSNISNLDFNIRISSKPIKPQGKRGTNIELTGFNPAIYNAWM